MKLEHKIFLDKDDTVEAAVDSIVTADASRVVLNIPKNSGLAESVNNFHMLNRESTTAGKELEIESVDDHVLELATLAGIKASNPIFRTKERSFADIVVKPVARKISKPVSSVTDPALLSPESTPEPDEEPSVPVRKQRTPKTAKARPEEKDTQSHTEPSATFFDRPTFQPVPRPHEERQSIPVRRYVIGVGVIVLLGLAGWAAAAWLPKATIAITLTRVPVQFNEIIEVDKKATAVDVRASGTIVLPGQFSPAKRNLVMSFPTEGREKIEVKATGKLTVSNAFSSDPQILVVSTRFESPEGKVFRLNQKTTIPGAKIVNGKIEPSTIDVQVTADAAGPEYNVQPSTGWHIPGFKGSPKYEAFTAAATTAMTGGFSGERPVPSTDDTTKAAATLTDTLRDALMSQITILFPTDKFKLLDGASSFSVTQKKVTSNDQQPGEFSMFAEAEMRELVFDEQMLKDALVAHAESGMEQAMQVRSLDLTYGNARVDLTAGTMSFPVSGTIVLSAKVSGDDLRGNLVGKDESAIRGSIFTLSGVERANVSLWPFWVHRVPENPDRVTVTVD